MRTFRLARTTAPMTVLAAVMLLAAYAGWRDYARLVAHAAPSPGSERQRVSTAPAPGTRNVPPAARRTLPDANLFGAPAPSPARGEEQATTVNPAPLDDAALPASTAAYRLFGIIDAAVERDRRIVLGTGDGDQRKFAIGDEAPDGARVHAIRARAAILERAGVLERLDLQVETDESMSRLGAPPGDDQAAAVAPARAAAPGQFAAGSLPVTARNAATPPAEEPYAD